MAISDTAQFLPLPNKEVDKNVFLTSGTFTVPAGAGGTQGIFYIPHGQGQALLPEGMFTGVSNNVDVPANYQQDGVTFALACDATNIIVSWYKITSAVGDVSYWIKLVAK